MVDALVPLVGSLMDCPDGLGAAIAAAEQAAEATSELAGRKGRSAYLQGRERGRPDPGAMAVSIWARAASSVMMSP
jgi:hypothetical protein